MPDDQAAGALQFAGQIGSQGLLSKTPNQRALAQVHEGLSKVPFGPLFEQYAQWAFNKDLTGGGGSGSWTPAEQSQIDRIEHDANEAANCKICHDPAAYAIQIADAVWNHVLHIDGNVSADYAVSLMYISAWRQSQIFVGRPFNALNFYVSPSLNHNGFPLSVLPNLSMASPSANLPGESDFEMLVRLYPAYSWEENYQDTGLPGAPIPYIGSAISAFAYYSPLPPGLNSIHGLWDYTPSSGPPARNGIDDSMSIWSLLPVQY